MELEDHERALLRRALNHYYRSLYTTQEQLVESGLPIDVKVFSIEMVQTHKLNEKLSIHASKKVHA